MKKFLLLIILLALAAAGLIWAYREMSAEQALEAEIEAVIASPATVHRSEDGTVVVELSPEAQRQADLETTPVSSIEYHPTLAVLGQVLDPAELAQARADLATVEGNLAVAQRELDYQRKLADQGNASARSVQKAEATAAQLEVQQELVRSRLVQQYGADFATLFPRLGSLIDRSGALVRLEVPLDAPLTNTHTDVAILTPACRLTAAAVAPPQSVDPQTQRRTLLVWVAANGGHLLPGQAVQAELSWPGDPVPARLIPVAAIVYQHGRPWVYAPRDTNTFERVLLHPLHFSLTEVVVTNFPADTVVLRGAQLLLSEEQKGAIQMAD